MNSVKVTVTIEAEAEGTITTITKTEQPTGGNPRFYADSANLAGHRALRACIAGLPEEMHTLVDAVYNRERNEICTPHNTPETDNTGRRW